MTRLLAAAEAPAHYQVPIFRQLARELGQDAFRAVYRSSGQAKEGWSPEWNAQIVNETGLLQGYCNRTLEEMKGSASHLARLREIIDEFRPECVLLTSHLRGISGLLVALQPYGQYKLILRSTPYDLQTRSMVSHLAREVVLRAAYSRFSAFCAVGTLPRYHFEKFSGRAQAVFNSPYCTDEDVLSVYFQKRTELRSSTRQLLGISDDELVFLVCGRLAPEKRIDMSIAVHRSLQPSIPNTLLIAGSGPLQASLEGSLQPKDSIKFLGFQKRAGVASIMSASDVLLLPSAKEPWGAVVNEALTFGLPVVASRAVGAGVDLVLDGCTGYRFDTNDAVGFFTATKNAVELARTGLESRVVQGLLARHSVAQATQGVLDAVRFATRGSHDG